jgi:signal transduction histidine kinase
VWQRVEAQEQERRRWARELHDETLQELAALKLLAGAARRASTAEEWTAALDQISGRADVAVGALRGLITGLRPAALDELQLQVALETLVERTARAHGLAVDLHVELAGEPNAPVRLPAEIEDTIYRVVQEALSNVVKHAAADRADVHVVQMDATVEVTVRDDGAGFDPSADAAGFGLIGIRERAALIDGTVQIESAPGTGTTIRVSLPVEPGGQVQAVAL